MFLDKLDKIKSLIIKPKVFDEQNTELLNKTNSENIKSAYNSVVTNLIYSKSDKKCKKTLITSYEYGEGKTSFAINLSIALAYNLINKKILLIDADINAPHVAEFINGELVETENKIGLSEYLSDPKSECNIEKTEINNLDVILAGKNNENASGFINSDRMSELLNKLENEYDYIIIDTAPTNRSSDAVMLSKDVDGYILSTKAKFTTVQMLSSITDKLDSIGANIHGVVLTH